jgi:hypothetical protein
MTILASNYDKSLYFKAADLKVEKKVPIKDVTVEEIGTGADKQEKLVVWLHAEDQGLPLNRVNNRTLRDAFGDAVDGWIGKVIVLFPTTAEFRGRLMPAIRIRIPTPTEKTPSDEKTVAVAMKDERGSAKPKEDGDDIEKAAKQKDDFDDPLDDI